MYSKIFTYIPTGFEAVSTIVEASILPGLPSFTISGMGSSKTKEVEARLRSALVNTGFKWPKGRIITAVAPAWMAKAGSFYDLPLAMALLEASGQIGRRNESYAYRVVGELGLQGQIRSVPSIFTCLEQAAKDKALYVFIPRDEFNIACFFPEAHIIGVATLAEVIDYYRGVRKLPEKNDSVKSLPRAFLDLSDEEDVQSFLSFQGQSFFKRALLISLAGWHPLIALGSPGSGKSMLISTARSLLPSLSLEEYYEVLKVYSFAQKRDSRILEQGQRPFLSPHFSVTKAALLGGGSPIKPGLFSLAHSGILFLDELTEYSGSKLEGIREALSRREVHLARSQESINIPANFLLLSAANPCPCGYSLDRRQKCHCKEEQVIRYLQRISGPIWNRFHLMSSVVTEDIQNVIISSKDLTTKTKEFYDIKDKIKQVWVLQQKRNLTCPEKTSGLSYLNGFQNFFQMTDSRGVSKKLSRYVEDLANRLNMNMRSIKQLVSVARTIADLEGDESIMACHIDEAVFYRVDPFRIK